MGQIGIYGVPRPGLSAEADFFSRKKGKTFLLQNLSTKSVYEVNE